MDTELITVIVPIYNVEKYLKKCIDSIINQSYTNLEIILVDDGSPDSCGKICDEYAKKDNRIKVIHKENGGLSDARNHGIDLAQGKYITFVDSDDYINSKYIESLHNAIQVNNTKISQCNILRVNEKDEIIEKRGYEDVLIKTGKEILGEAYGEHCVENVVAWNKMYEIELFKHLRYPIGKIHEDEFTTYKILYNVDKVAIVKDYLYNYRKNQNSITESKFNLKRLDMLEAFEGKMEFFKQKNEKYLYELTQRQYLYTIIYNYRKTLQNIPNPKEVLKKMLTKYRIEYRNAKDNNVITKREKLKMTIYYYWPRAFYAIQDIKRGLSE